MVLLRKLDCLAYWIKLVVKTSMVYNKRVLMQMIRTLAGFAAMIFVWKALIANGIRMNVTLDTLILYSVLSTVISCLVQTNAISGFFQSELISGSIAVRLMRPVSMEAMSIANVIGYSINGLIVYGLTFAVAVSFFIRVSPDITFLSVLAFLGCLFMGCAVFMLIDFICAYICFYIHKGSTIEHLIEAIFMAFSGQVIPLFLLPEWFGNISMFLPVRMVYEEPISILLGITPQEQWGGVFLREAVWIVVLLAVTLVMKSMTRRKVFVQGG